VSSTTPNIGFGFGTIETWTLTCIDAATVDTEIFSVVSDISPDTYPPAVVGTPYDVGDISFTIEKLNTGAAYAFSSASGLEDTFIITVNSQWEVQGSSSGLQVNEAETGTAYQTDGNEVGFTIADAARLYEAGDEFTFTVNQANPYWRVDGSVSGLQDDEAYTDVAYISDNQEVSFTITSGVSVLADGDTITLEVTESGLGYGRIVRDIEYASGSGESAVLYAATATGVFKTIDGGQRWAEVSNFPGDNITTLEVHPGLTNTVYAGTLESGVYYSTDGGANWTNATSAGLGYGLSATTPLADTNNTGTGIMSTVNVLGEPDTQTENWTVVYNFATATPVFDVTGSVSLSQPGYAFATATPPGAYTIADVLSFTISEGAVPFANGDTFTFSTTRDHGLSIKDLLVYNSGTARYLYALTYFEGALEPHAVGNIYALDLRNVAHLYAPAVGATWDTANDGLAEYDPPSDESLFAQHVLAIENPNGTGNLFVGGEGIHFYKATDDLAGKDPQWFASESGLTNLIMSRMPILFTDDCTMQVNRELRDLDGDGNLDDYWFTVYIQDQNGNPPIQGSNFTLARKCGSEETVIATIDYPDTYIHQGTFRDIADPSTDWPYVYTVIDPLCEYIFTFTPTCDPNEAPGCSGGNQEITY
jgi:hypothetical protein